MRIKFTINDYGKKPSKRLISYFKSYFENSEAKLNDIYLRTYKAIYKHFKNITKLEKKEFANFDKLFAESCEYLAKSVQAKFRGDLDNAPLNQKYICREIKVKK
jgi:hypothetical protein